MPEPNPVRDPPPLKGLDDLQARLSDAAAFRAAHGRPFVVLTYAQSVDGSIAGRQRERVRLSGEASMQLTYAIRGRCSAILIGIGTLLADDPALTAKDRDDRHPQPVVLDTGLRTPVGARLLQRRDAQPWLIHGEQAPPVRRSTLAAAGAVPIACPLESAGRIDLERLMRCLAERSVDSLMVEGGARVITNFIRHRLADVFIITISPRLLGGLPVIDPAESAGALDLRFAGVTYQVMGPDLIVWAQAPGRLP